MRHQPVLSHIVFACISLYFGNAVHAAQQESVNVHQVNTELFSGKITEVINTDSFTYIEVDTGKEKSWVAGPVTPLKKGEMVSFTKTMLMKNFHSKSLERNFSVLYITNSFNASKYKSLTSPMPAKKTALSIGDYLRDVTLDGLDGKIKSFAAFKGKPLLINIWASWCGPCRAEMGSLERLAQRYNGKEFNIIGISTDDYRNKASAAIRQSGITFENFLDHNLVLENMLGAKTIPLTLLVSANSQVLKVIHGERTWDSSEMIKVIGNVFHLALLSK